MIRRFASVAALLTLSACATVSQAVNDKEKGTTHLYATSCEDLWPLSVRVFRDAGAGVVEEHKDQDLMLAESGLTIFTSGTYMVAWLQPASGHQCSVTVVTKRRVSVSLITRLTEGGYHEELARLAAMRGPMAPAEQGRGSGS